MTRVLVLHGFGLNCEEETAAAYALCGAQPIIAHAGDWLEGLIRLSDFDVLHLPGGFSYGDNLGAGRVLANRLRYTARADGSSVWNELLEFTARGGRVIGICNGFQALVRSGLLPNVGGKAEQEVSLAANATGQFIDHWVRCRMEPGAWLGAADAVFELPIRHGEGRIVFKDADIERAVAEQGLVLLRYVDANGEPATRTPANPNGSPHAIAGLRSADGRVLGLMPHPEAFLFNDVHPHGARRASALEADGLQFFRSFLAAVKKDN